MVAITVADVMTEDVETVASEVSAMEVAERLRADDIGSLVVVADGEPVGIVTDTDLIELLVAGGDHETDTAGNVMSSPLVTVEAEASVAEAVETFREHGVSKLPATHNGELVGIATTADVSHYVPQVIQRRFLRRQTQGEPQFEVRPDTAYELDNWAFESWCVSEEGVSVGDSVEFSKTLDDEDVRTFARVSGDTNRLHLEDGYAAETRFGRRIVHGTLVSGLISAALARLPGLTIYLSQDLSFLKPVDVGQRVTAVCEVVEDLGRDRYVLTTDVFADGEEVIEGEAVVMIDEVPEVERVETEPVEE